jgi:hypothetical protein
MEILEGEWLEKKYNAHVQPAAGRNKQPSNIHHPVALL